MNTQLKLLTALQRIVDGSTKFIEDKRKLSVRAVEDEAQVGKDTAYYYPEIIEKIKKLKNTTNSEKTTQEINHSEEYLVLKNKHLKEREKRKEANKIISQHAACLHQLQFALNNSIIKNQMLKQELHELKEEVVLLRRNNITQINKAKK